MGLLDLKGPFKEDIAAFLKMEGPYILNKENVDKYIMWSRIGNYALCHIDGNSVLGVGRSDKDLHQHLEAYIYGIAEETLAFMFSYAENEEEAYLKECQHYHFFEPEFNGNDHPIQPEGQDLKCPVCGR